MIVQRHRTNIRKPPTHDGDDSGKCRWQRIIKESFDSLLDRRDRLNEDNSSSQKEQQHLFSLFQSVHNFLQTSNPCDSEKATRRSLASSIEAYTLPVMGSSSYSGGYELTTFSTIFRRCSGHPVGARQPGDEREGISRAEIATPRMVYTRIATTRSRSHKEGRQGTVSDVEGKVHIFVRWGLVTGRTNPLIASFAPDTSRL